MSLGRAARRGVGVGVGFGSGLLLWFALELLLAATAGAHITAALPVTATATATIAEVVPTQPPATPTTLLPPESSELSTTFTVLALMGALFVAGVVTVVVGVRMARRS